jgi:hypothetical protein
MNMEHLPAPTRKLLRDMDYNQLNFIYHSRVHYVDSNGHLQNMTVKKISKEALNGMKPVIKIMFNVSLYS